MLNIIIYSLSAESLMKDYASALQAIYPFSYYCKQRLLKCHKFINSTDLIGVFADHLGELLASVVFIERIACFLLEVLQMCSYQHVPKREEIAVLQALDLRRKKNFWKKLIERRVLFF